jgi:hypothetical protein
MTKTIVLFVFVITALYLGYQAVNGVTELAQKRDAQIAEIVGN